MTCGLLLSGRGVLTFGVGFSDGLDFDGQSVLVLAHGDHSANGRLAWA